MAVQVLFFSPKGIGSINAPGVGQVRLREALSLGDVTTGAAEHGEAVVVFNGEASPVLVAHGSAPNAAVTEATPATTAGYAVPAGQCSPPFMVATGAKVSVASAS